MDSGTSFSVGQYFNPFCTAPPFTRCNCPVRTSEVLLASSKPTTLHFAAHSPLTCQWPRHSKCWSLPVECPGWGQTGNGRAGEEAGAKMEPAALQPWQLSHWNQKLLPEMMTKEYLLKQSAHSLSYCSWACQSQWQSGLTELDLDQIKRTRMVPELAPHQCHSTTVISSIQSHSADNILLQNFLLSNLHFKIPIDLICKNGGGEFQQWRFEYVPLKEILSQKKWWGWATAYLELCCI